jgi:hypothetical protein
VRFDAGCMIDQWTDRTTRCRCLRALRAASPTKITCSFPTTVTATR